MRPATEHIEFTPQRLASSVVAVPPIARDDDLAYQVEENAKLIAYLRAGGVRTLLYGGNANFYNISFSEYARLLDMLAEAAGDDMFVIPSVGPAFGTMMDQARILRQKQFATAMVLPPAFAATQDGFATGVRHFVEAAGIPAVLYIKHEGQITVDAVARLMDDGLLSAIKYAIVRDDPAQDEYLRLLVDSVDPQRIMSGIGEQPAIVHLRDFGLGGFTSGCVCVAPKLSMQMLAALQAGDFAAAERIREIFQPLEDLRNRISPIRVLHDAVSAANVARTGPILPHLSNVSAGELEEIQPAAIALRKANEG
ncbi:MAG: dihydrodipicolinate synthase family protein [Planctomycetales bacterium]|nr:dihydrodipicolinate synthase family protein [Planctomycetales bacterium]